MSDVKIIRPRICQIERAGFATEMSSVMTPFQRSLPTNARITIARMYAKTAERNTT